MKEVLEDAFRHVDIESHPRNIYISMYVGGSCHTKEHI